LRSKGEPGRSVQQRLGCIEGATQRRWKSSQKRNGEFTGLDEID
jgi:hypothetical protein